MLIVGQSPYAMERVAEPLPAFACTTSVPPSCVRFVRASISCSVMDFFGATCKDPHSKPTSDLDDFHFIH